MKTLLAVINVMLFCAMSIVAVAKFGYVENFMKDIVKDVVKEEVTVQLKEAFPDLKKPDVNSWWKKGVTE